MALFRSAWKEFLELVRETKLNISYEQKIRVLKIIQENKLNSKDSLLEFLNAKVNGTVHETDIPEKTEKNWNEYYKEIYEIIKSDLPKDKDLWKELYKKVNNTNLHLSKEYKKSVLYRIKKWKLYNKKQLINHLKEEINVSLKESSKTDTELNLAILNEMINNIKEYLN